MKTCRRRSGQAALEYVLVFVALLGLVAALVWFAKATRKTAKTTAELVTCDSP